jgi:hypothetical protein
MNPPDSRARRAVDRLVEAEAVTAMDKATAKRIHHEADDLMRTLAEDLGMQHAGKGGSYS